MLTARPAAPTEAGCWVGDAYQRSPPRYDYVLTGAGLEPPQPVHGLRGGRSTAAGDPPRGFHHAVRGTRLDPAGGCPLRGVPLVGPAEVETRSHHDGAAPRRDDPVCAVLAAPARCCGR